jgi:hypothetical protein
MASIKDLDNLFEQMREAIRQRLPDALTTMVVTAKALAEREIVENGIGKVYSREKYPAFFLAGKELNQKGTTFLAAHGVDTTGKQTGNVQRKGKATKRELTYAERLTNWAEFREAQGLQSNHVDMHYSNKMYANMGPRTPEIDGDKVTVRLGATNKEAQDKMNWNYERYGDFITPAITPESRILLTQVLKDEVLNFLQPFRP